MHVRIYINIYPQADFKVLSTMSKAVLLTESLTRAVGSQLILRVPDSSGVPCAVHACLIYFLSLHICIHQCIRSIDHGCHSLSKWLSVSSSHLDSSRPHISSHPNALSSDLLATRWCPADCHHNISGVLYTQRPCTCHNVHSQSGRTNPTWIWFSLLSTHSYYS